MAKRKKKSDTKPVLDVALADIQVLKECQPRAQIHTQTVDEYAERLEAGDTFPPVVAFTDGKAYWLADGFHRFFAAEKAGWKSIAVEVHEGGKDAARWHALGANKTHGLRRTNADKERAVKEALAARPDLSDRAIADHVGVSHPFVGKCRSEAESAGAVETVTTRTGKDGVEQPAHKPGKIDADAIPMGDEEPAGDDAEPVAQHVVECPECQTLVPAEEGIAEYECPACKCTFEDDSPESDDDDPATPEEIADAEGLPEPTPEDVEQGKREAANATRGGKKKAEPPPPEVPTDPYGNALESAVAAAFLRKGELTQLMGQISKVKTAVLKAIDDNDSLFAPVLPAQFKADAENLRRQLAACVPHAACPHCRQIGCEICHGRGYVDKEVYERWLKAQDGEPFEPDPEPDPEPDGDDPPDSDVEETCAMCGKPATTFFRCRGCNDLVAVCDKCDDDRGSNSKCPNCQE